METEEKLKERVTFIHEKIGTDALIEQYIDGREVYVGVIGNERLRVLPVWELNFGDVTEDGKRIATAAVKHDIEYQQRHNVTEGPAKGLAPGNPWPASSASPSASAARWNWTAIPHRFPPGRGRHALLHRGQPQPRDRQDRRVRPRCRP